MSSTTERKEYTFRVKEYDFNHYYILPEPMSGDLSIMQNGFLFFDLPENTTKEKAYEIAQYLGKNILELGYTNIDPS